MANPVNREGQPVRIMSFVALSEYKGPKKREIVAESLATAAAGGEAIDPKAVIGILRQSKQTIKGWKRIIAATEMGIDVQGGLNSYEWREPQKGRSIVMQYAEVGLYAQRRLRNLLSRLSRTS